MDAAQSVRDRVGDPTTLWERGHSVAKEARALASGEQGDTVGLVSGVVALAGLGPLAVLRVALNGPVALPGAASGAWIDAATTAALLGPALAVLLRGVTATDVRTAIGPVVVGVFGLLSVASPAAALSAVGAVVAGGWGTLLGATDAARRGCAATTTAPNPHPRRLPALVVASALLGGLTLSLLGTVGVSPATTRPAGTALALAGAAASPVAFRSGPRVLVAGGLAAGATYAVTGAAPFVSGAVVLVAGSAVGASAPLLAVAVGGVTATVATGLATRRLAPAVAGLLLLTAGVPSSLPRALGVVLAVTFVVGARTDGSADPS